LLMVRVRAERKPERCVPPSTVLMVLGEGENVFRRRCRCIAAQFRFEAAALAFHIDRRIVERFLAAIEMLDEFGDAAGEAELRALFRAFVVGQSDLEAFVSRKAYSRRRVAKRVVAENGFVENSAVGMEGNFVPVLRVLPVCLSFEVGLPFS